MTSKLSLHIRVLGIGSFVLAILFGTAFYYYHRLEEDYLDERRQTKSRYVLKIVARLMAKSPTAEEDAVAGAYMHALARQLGVAQKGVLAVYFADEDDWRIWIGDDLASEFLGRPALPADLGEGAALHQAKEAFFATVKTLPEKNTARERARRSAENPLTPADLIKFSTDAMLDSLIFRFEPKSTP